MPTCNSPSCECNNRRPKSAPRWTPSYERGQKITLSRLRKIPGLTITQEGTTYWLSFTRGEEHFRAPAVIMHGLISIRTAFDTVQNRVYIPIRRRPDSDLIFHSVREATYNYAMYCAMRVHSA